MMHSQSIQAVVHKYIFARDAALKAKRKGYKYIRYPYKQKRNYNTKWVNNGFTINYDKGYIDLKLGNWQGKRLKPIRVYVKYIPQNVKEIELNYNYGLELIFYYDDLKEIPKPKGNNICAVDIGEIHTIAAVSSNGKSIIITGRLLRSIKQFRNKKYAELQRKISKCKKGSREYKKYKKALNYILAKSDRQILDKMHKITKKFVDFAVENDISTVIIGDLEGIQRYTRKRRNKKTNQKLSQLPFGKLYSMLEYKLKEKGIKLIKKSESYTTQTCPRCKRIKKPNGRNYKCKCGYIKHRDIHGASNFLSKYLYGEFREINVKPFEFIRVA